MAIEIPISIKRTEPPPEYGDLRDAFDLDTLFVVLVISDAMRRGAPYFKLCGAPLACVYDALDALAEDGEILTKIGLGKDEPRH